MRFQAPWTKHMSSYASAPHKTSAKAKPMPCNKASAKSSEGGKNKDTLDLGMSPLVMEQLKLFLKDMLTESLASKPHTLEQLSTSRTAQVKRKAHTSLSLGTRN